jgi:hypothetical protein
VKIEKLGGNNLVASDISIKELYDALNEIIEDDAACLGDWYLCKVLRIMVNRAMTGNSVQQAKDNMWNFYYVGGSSPVVMQGVLVHLFNQMNNNTKRTFIANQKRGGSGIVIEEWSQTKSWNQFISQFSQGEQKLRPMTRLRKNMLKAILDKNPNAKLEVKLEF